MTDRRPIVVAGAGAIGCFVGGMLAAHGHDVTLLVRPGVAGQIRTHGLRLTDFDGLDEHVPASKLTLSQDPTCLAEAGIVLVTVKTADTAGMARLIAQHTPALSTVLSLQNGLDAAEILRELLPLHDVRAGMVPFNVVPHRDGRYHRATSGDIVVETGRMPLSGYLSVPGLRMIGTGAINGVQWGKLLLNLNNGLNALSGLTLQEQLLDRRWRRVMAAQMVEALAVLKAHGIYPASSTPLPARLIPWVLRLPTPLFSRVAARMLTIDPMARTSMSYDLEAGKPTEIDALQGRIIAMGAQEGVATPLCQRVRDLVKEAQARGPGLPNLTPSDLR
tara:strand:+ start:1643 stop:2641 length:999 start_codon:yes stop_codon:yes gene_type:complete